MTGGDRRNHIDHHRDTDRIRKVYDDIAAHFSKTREYAWPEVETFVRNRAPATRGLDVGCGNGRHMAVLDRKVDHVVGVDVSRNLLQEATARRSHEGWNGEFVTGDAARVPIASDTVDIGVYVATVHHLPSRDQRRASFDELARVLREGGYALVSAWSTTHERFEADASVEEGFDTTVEWTLPDGDTVPRYYHIYAPAEFEADLAESSLRVCRSFLSSGNCYAVVASDEDEGKRP
jgi:ubiquinone/menaquinone biosynthesis C-methylase UbiE